MKQSKLMSWIETCLNTGIGFVIAMATQVLVFPLFGYSPPLSTNFKIACIFTVVSIVRGFVLRRLFEALRIRRLNRAGKPAGRTDPVIFRPADVPAEHRWRAF